MEVEQEKAVIVSIAVDHLENDTLPEYLRHIGFDIGALNTERDLPHALLGHYRIKQGYYDVNRACMDLATWPPVASRIVERMANSAKA